MYAILIFQCIPFGILKKINSILFNMKHTTGDTHGKESACDAGAQFLSLGPERSPWRRNWQHTLVLLPGEFHTQRNLAGYSSWSHKESDTND